jgi:hypothetical protein
LLQVALEEQGVLLFVMVVVAVAVLAVIELLQDLLFHLLFLIQSL